MLTTKEIFLIAALLCLVMVLALYSFKHYSVRGIDDLLFANVLGMGANMLYAFGREVPPLVAYEMADGLYAAAAGAMLLAFRRLFGRPAPGVVLLAAVIVYTALIAVFHYRYDSYAARTLLTSLFLGSVGCDIVYGALRRRGEWRAARYPLLFLVGMSMMVAAGHLARGIGQLFLRSAPQSLLEPAGWNLFFLSAGAVMLPVLTLGGLLTVQRRLLSRAEHAANRDFLTGAWSRRAFFDMAGREIARAKRSDAALSLLLIDLDELKGVNDTHGHAAGDDLLCSFVRNAQHTLRAIDVLARLGGDEFAVLMPETDLDGALVVAARLKSQRLAGEPMEPPKFSAGLAALRPDDSLQMLLERADSALYEAKTHGRNQIALES